MTVRQIVDGSGRRPVVYDVVGEIDSDSMPGVMHIIKRHRITKGLSCDCMAWRFCRGAKQCKHVDAFLLATVRDEIREVMGSHPDAAVFVTSASFTQQPVLQPGVRRLRLRD